MPELLDIGETIKRLRREAGVTREQLAALSDVSRARIEALENQRAPDMGYNAVCRLLRALGQDLVLTTFNRGRPTADDLRRENEAIEATRRRRATKLER
jgi:transcriptional regulator with XRE-family HTH domain